MNQSLRDLVYEVYGEVERAQDSHHPMHSAHEGYSVILEEVDELWDEVKLNPRKNPQRNATMRKEAIQVAAMAIRFVLDVCDKKVDEEQSGTMRGKDPSFSSMPSPDDED